MGAAGSRGSRAGQKAVVVQLPVMPIVLVGVVVEEAVHQALLQMVVGAHTALETDSRGQAPLACMEVSKLRHQLYSTFHVLPCLLL